MKLNNFFTSGWTFEDSQIDIKSKFQMINVAIALASFSIIYGIIVNFARDTLALVPIELTILLINVVLFVILRISKNSFEFVATILTAQFSFLMLLLVYVSDPVEVKHVWLYTYPIIILYFQKVKLGIIWTLFMLTVLLIAPFQGFFEVQYSFFQLSYISFVFIIVALIVYFYHYKMQEARDLILKQQHKLLSFNTELETQVNNKTAELTELNELLEERVQNKINELKQKDKILTDQSKQAVMGEMISMIAHQWRQPLSTITLQIADLQLKKLLNTIDDTQLDNTLSNISDTIIYLSNTIDDFQTYFHPGKESVEIEIHELLQRAINFALPRVKENGIVINLENNENIYVSTYINELIQVVLNIINNSIDALNEKKIVYGEDLLVFISVRNHKHKLIITLKDNAGGIDEDNMPKLFEPYFSTKGKNGTGLGLYMSQMIIQKQFNGEIYANNYENGAMFTIEIPYK